MQGINKMDYRDYSALKLLIDQYWHLKEVNKYDEFITKLVTILGL